MKTLLTILLMSVGLCAQSQQVFAEIGHLTSHFDYEDSEGAGLESLYPESSISYSIGYRHILSPIFQVTGSVVYNRYRSFGSDPLYDNKYSWDTRYLGIGLGVEGEFYKVKRFRFLAKISAEPQLLMGGTQTINNEIYDLKGVEQFDRPFLFLRGGLGANYCVDSRVAVTARYYYGKGIPIGKSDDPENLWMTTGTVTLGVLVSFKDCRYCFKDHFFQN